MGNPQQSVMNNHSQPTGWLNGGGYVHQSVMPFSTSTVDQTQRVEVLLDDLQVIADRTGLFRDRIQYLNRLLYVQHLNKLGWSYQMIYRSSIRTGCDQPSGHSYGGPMITHAVHINHHGEPQRCPSECNAFFFFEAHGVAQFSALAWRNGLGSATRGERTPTNGATSVTSWCRSGGFSAPAI